MFSDEEMGKIVKLLYACFVDCVLMAVQLLWLPFYLVARAFKWIGR